MIPLGYWGVMVEVRRAGTSALLGTCRMCIDTTYYQTAPGSSEPFKEDVKPFERLI